MVPFTRAIDDFRSFNNSLIAFPNDSDLMRMSFTLGSLLLVGSHGVLADVKPDKKLN